MTTPTLPLAVAAIGARLRVARKDRQLSLADVAGRTSISAATLSRIENGKQPLGLELFLTLSTVLQVPADKILAPETEAVAAQPRLPKPVRERRRPLDVRLDELVQQVELLRRKIVAMRDDLARSNR